MHNGKNPLYQVILKDLFRHNKVALFLLICVAASGLSTVWITQKTRALVTEKDHLIKSNQRLDNQYLNLQLEENNASHRMQIEIFAVKFGLKTIEKTQETIVEE